MRAGILALFLLLTAAAPAVAQPAPIPYRDLPFTLDSGVRRAPAAERDAAVARPVLVWRELVRTEAAWLRLFFREVDLGPGGFIRIVSVADRAEQTLDARTLSDWRNSSAMFNGDSVEVELHAPPGTDARVAIDHIWAGEQREAAGVDTICGLDDRVSWDDRATGRIVPVGCTAWLVANGAILTAGHCNVPGFQIMQFQVPQSLCGGTMVNPPPADQYPVIAGSMVTQSGAHSVGNDWGIFRVGPSGNGGENVFERQAQYFRVTQSPYTMEAPVRITGFGTDEIPAGCAGGRNSNNQTEQSDAGPFKGQTAPGASVTIAYHLDTTGGNSGSPVIINGSRTTIGIHTNGCDGSPTSTNKGTGFTNTTLATALAQWNGIKVMYVDAGSPEIVANGTLFTPFRTVTDAVAAAGPGATISIAGGSYDRVLTLNKAMKLFAPSGMVILGKDPTLR